MFHVWCGMSEDLPSDRNIKDTSDIIVLSHHHHRLPIDFNVGCFKLDLWGVFSPIFPSTSLFSSFQWCYQHQWSFSSKKVDFWHHSPLCLHPCQLPSNDASVHLCNAASAHHVSFFQTSVHRRRQLLVAYRLAFWQHDQPIEADFWPTWPRHFPYWLFAELHPRLKWISSFAFPNKGACCVAPCESM